MIKLKKIKLTNYCGFRNFELDLSENDSVKKWVIAFGSNGLGKTNFIRAVDMLSSPKRFKNRDNMFLFRRLKYHPDYISGIESIYDNPNDLKMEATFFSDDGIEKRVVFADNVTGVLHGHRRIDKEKGEISGVEINELLPEEEGSIFIDADSRNMMNKFQLPKNLIEPFCDFASIVYGLVCSCPEAAITIDRSIEYCTDLIIKKNDNTKVHYKRFSDGEKKIATLISSLFKRGYKDSLDKENKNIFIIDNIEMHIYWERHMKLINTLAQYFPEKQIIATTHSPIIINTMAQKYLVKLEEYIK